MCNTVTICNRKERKYDIFILFYIWISFYISALFCSRQKENKTKNKQEQILLKTRLLAYNMWKLFSYVMARERITQSYYTKSVTLYTQFPKRRLCFANSVGISEAKLRSYVQRESGTFSATKAISLIVLTLKIRCEECHTINIFTQCS